MVLMMSNTDVGGIHTGATRRCRARITTSPAAVRASVGGWLLPKKSKVNSCKVCQIARPFGVAARLQRGVGVRLELDPWLSRWLAHTPNATEWSASSPACSPVVKGPEVEVAGRAVLLSMCWRRV